MMKSTSRMLLRKTMTNDAVCIFFRMADVHANVMRDAVHHVTLAVDQPWFEARQTDNGTSMHTSKNAS